MRRLPFELTVLLPLLALGACRDAGGPGGPLERGTRTFKGTWCGFAIDGTSDGR